MKIPEVPFGTYVMAYFPFDGGWRIAKYGPIRNGLAWTAKGTEELLMGGPLLPYGAFPDPTANAGTDFALPPT